MFVCVFVCLFVCLFVCFFLSFFVALRSRLTAEVMSGQSFILTGTQQKKKGAYLMLFDDN